MSRKSKKANRSTTISPRINGKPYLQLCSLVKRGGGEELFTFWVKHDEVATEIARHKVGLLSVEKAQKWRESDGFLGWEVKKL
tara:strand:+ start:41 stop:289 length:249 start_codon:yes stop_codon:yes gene_type:complete